MPTPSNRPLSILSLASGAVFLVTAFGAPMFESPVLFIICAVSVPVLLLALVNDVCHKRFWALVPLAILIGAFVWLALALRGFDIPVGG